ncbi:NAD-dependent epimerase/dehydratase family protein [Candidatus Pelagibacter bacterium]|nr:NAD-dependent epimerase/dehydratase family protein [Candidatus Pelagibacter bacterium]
MINLNSKIYIAGHRGLVGSAIFRQLKKKGYKKIIIADKSKLDLTNQSKVYNFLKKKKPKFIFIAAAKVGGIYSNSKYPAEFIHNNLIIQNNIIHSAYLCNIKDLIFLGSSCVYPKLCKQPIKEDYLLNGPLEKTNEAYAVAKIAGIKMCESYNLQFKTNYKCLMPTNTFGPNDNYDALNSHFFPSLIKKIHEIKIKGKKELTIWGDGSPKREVVYVDDIADACIYFMKKRFKQTTLNIGTGKDRSIEQYAKIILNLILPNKKIKIKYDKSKPNGTPRKVMDVSLAKKYGWKSKTDLKDAIKMTYNDYLSKNYC